MTGVPPVRSALERGFEPWLSKWGLEPEGPATYTRAGRFLPVAWRGEPAMLKVVTEQEEKDGVETLLWWAGKGAARVLAHDADAHVLERALGENSLFAMAHDGRDMEATRVLCAAAAVLHARDPGDRPATVVPLGEWFRELWPVARSHGGILEAAATTARGLLAEQHDLVVLHGDLHHGNVLDFGARGWLAIDPKGLYGERTFDFVNLLRNPDLEVALTPGRFGAHVRLIALEAQVDPLRLLQWTLAFGGLSAAWIINDGLVPELDVAVAELARAELALA